MKNKFLKICLLGVIALSLTSCPDRNYPELTDYGAIYTMGIFEGEDISIYDISTDITIDTETYPESPYGPLRGYAGTVQSKYTLYNNLDGKEFTFGIPITTTYNSNDIYRLEQIKMFVNNDQSPKYPSVYLGDMKSNGCVDSFDEIWQQTKNVFLPDDIYEYEIDIQRFGITMDFTFETKKMPNLFFVDETGHMKVEVSAIPAINRVSLSFFRKGKYIFYSTDELVLQDYLSLNGSISKNDFIEKMSLLMDFNKKFVEKRLELFSKDGVFNLYEYLRKNQETVYQNYMLIYKILLEGNNAATVLKFEYNINIDDEMKITYSEDSLNHYKNIDNCKIKINILSEEDYTSVNNYSSSVYETENKNEFIAYSNSSSDVFSIGFKVKENKGGFFINIFPKMLLAGFVFSGIYLIIYGVRRGKKNDKRN